MDSQARSLVIAIQSAILIFKLPTIGTTDCAICVIYFLGEQVDITISKNQAL